MERRTLSAAINAAPQLDPELVREFVTQERRVPSATPESRPKEHPLRTTAPETLGKRRRTKQAGVVPIGLIPVTVRLRPDVAGALKRASLERQLQGEPVFSQQDLVEQTLEPWLRAEGYLS